MTESEKLPAGEVQGTITGVPKSDLDRAYRALKGKQKSYNKLWDYYDGEQPLTYTSKRLRNIFKNLDTHFSENWCAVVIDAANDRIFLEKVTVEDAGAQAAMDEVWDNLDMDLEAADVHEAALVIGESFLIVWPKVDDQGVQSLEAFYNDPRLCHVFYQSDNPKVKEFAAKWWVDSEKHIRMTLYYKDRLEYYRSNNKQQNVTSVDSFKPFNSGKEDGGEQAPNETGIIPVFHWRLETRKIKSDMGNVIPLQDGINKLVTDMMVAAEFGAFKQRWIISNADTENLKNAPNEIWGVPAGDGQGQQTSVGQFEATDLENYIKGISHLANSVAIISRTPKHYLFGQGGTPSGEALIAMEAPLNKRVDDHIKRFKPVWREVAQFILLLLDKAIERTKITVQFDEAATVQPKTQAEVRESAVRAGIPLKTALRMEGWDDAMIAAMEKDKKEETKSNTENMAVAMLTAQRKFDGGDQEDEGSVGNDEPATE